jgi:ABC-type nickel/cobalt efflux system permease component RcnA
MIEFYNTILKQLTMWQYELNRTIATNIREINDENYLSIYSLIIGISFLYGLIHAAGPGHGKALVALYFTKGKGDYKEAFKLGYLISIIHAISAITVTFTLFFIFKTMFRQNFNEFSNTAMMISSVMIIFVGLYLIYNAVKEKYKPCHNENIPQDKSKYAVAFGVGLVPCPGVMTIVLFCIMLKKFTLGILAALAMSIGMGLTISIVGILSVLFANRTSTFVNKKAYILEAVSGVLIVLLGSFLFLAVKPF